MAARCPDAFLLIDETYRQAAYDDDEIAPSAALLGPQVIVTGSLSKCHGAPGLRIGWAIVRDKALREQIVLGKFNTVIANSTVDEMLGLARPDPGGRPIIAARRKHLGEGLARTAAWVARRTRRWLNGSSPMRARSAASACGQSSSTRPPSPAFYAALAALDARVGDGTWFGEEPRVFRLGFGLSADCRT